MTKDEISKYLGEPMLKEEVMARINENEYTKNKFDKYPEKMKNEFLNFCMGNQGLKISYDPFFKYIFNPGNHPERLSEFLSLILGEDVEIVEVLPNESDRISQKDSLLIMDVLVKTRKGELINVEIQRAGYHFQGERASCYSSDLLMREFSRKKAEYGDKFEYGVIKKVYTVILIEESTSEYKKYLDKYIHRGKVKFDTGLPLEMLQEYIIISLDVFKKIHHNKLNKLEAWLYFVSSEQPADIIRIIEAYPQFKQLYGELAALRFKTRELIEMYDVYREAFRIADENAARYIVEQQRMQIEQLKNSNEQLQSSNEQLQSSNEQLQSNNEQLQNDIEQLRKKIEELQRQVEVNDN